jgi:hypothetical protein
MFITIERWMIMMNHSWWAIIMVSTVGILAFVLGSRIRNTITRTAVLGVAVITLAFVMSTGVIAPLDNWQHQHGSCLLDTLGK